MTTKMKRKPNTAAYKFKVVLAALRGEKSAAELCQEFRIVSSQLHKWKKQRARDDENLTVDVINEIRDIYAKRPFQGYKRITDDLKDRGHPVNHKRVYRLMKMMGLQAVYHRKNLSKRHQEDGVYPYLLKKHLPEKVHDCWQVDITYIKTAKRFIYLTALIDVVSRCVMGYSVRVRSLIRKVV
ncbi:MAG: IS3 family transposase [Proteobacteria bacterium]|nr:IS3 family transposase [Pseudomonadota bacterium]